jgi:glyoxylase-like metal-dependent hydrolase (beta-lactamase superfamily II)
MVISQSLQNIAPGVWSWHAYDETVRTDLYSTAVLAESGLVLIDPIRLCDAGLDELALHKPVVAIVLTNENHSRSALWFRGRFGSPIFSHPDALGALTLAVDGTLGPVRRVAGNLTVLEIPGAASGEIALLHPGGSLHFGDAVVNLESTGLALLPDKYCLDPLVLKQSMQSLPVDGVELVTFAHGPALVQGGGKLIQSLHG